MRLFKTIVLVVSVIFLNSCKKDKDKEDTVISYPATFEFSTEGVETSTLGLAKDPRQEGAFIIQNKEYDIRSNQTKTVTQNIDTKRNTTPDIRLSRNEIRKEFGEFSVTGSIVVESKNSLYAGVSSYLQPANGQSDYFFYRLSTSNTLFQPSKVSNLNNLEINRILPVSDGFLMLGTRTTGGDKNVVVIKYGLNFVNKEWEREFGGTQDEGAMDMIQMCDNNYGILAYTYSKGAGDRDVWFLGINASGFLLWDSTYGGVGYEEPQRIVSPIGCDMYIAGHSASFGSPEHDGYILKINERGIKVWEKTFGTPNHDGFNAVTHIPNTNNFIAAGRSMQGIGQPEDVFIVCFDETGEELWRKKYGDPSLTELPQDIIADNQFYYLACNRVDNSGKFSAVFIKDVLGN